MKVILPMAGRGQRFKEEGFELPKPLIHVAGKPMVLHALDSLRNFDFEELIVVCLRSVEKEYEVSRLISEYISKPVEFVWLDHVTEGQLCTVLSAKEHMAADDDILIMASDSFIVSKLHVDIINKPKDCDGLISVALLAGSQWSFARTDSKGRVTQVAEKDRISDYASTGLYYFSRASDLIWYGEDMIRNNERTRGEFYVIPVYQKMIDDAKSINVSLASEMWDMGTPEAKLNFERFLIDSRN